MPRQAAGAETPNRDSAGGLRGNPAGGLRGNPAGGLRGNPAGGLRSIESENEFFEKAGPLPTAWNEVRRFPRFYLRTIAKAKIFPPQAAPHQAPKECRILTCDLSRGALAFLYKSLLFPGQRVDVVLHDNTSRSLEVLWCRRIGEGCYWAGARFIKTEAAVPAGEESQPGSSQRA